jgi:transcriptional regulator with XRE-family HTH domain
MTDSLKEKIIDHMKKKNLSISQLEKKAGLSIHSVRNILKGRIKKPSLHNLTAIANTLECSILELVNSPPPSNTVIPELPLKEQKLKAFIPFTEIGLMRECLEVIVDFMIEKNLSLSVDEYLDAVREAYTYSLGSEDKKADQRFALWLLESMGQK